MNMNVQTTSTSTKSRKSTKAATKSAPKKSAPKKSTKKVSDNFKDNAPVVEQVQAATLVPVDEDAMGKSVADVMPELKEGSNSGWRAASYADAPIARIYSGTDAIEDADGETMSKEDIWPGKSKYIEVWVVTTDGRAIGRHNGPRNRISYHIVGKKSLQKAGLI